MKRSWLWLPLLLAALLQGGCTSQSGLRQKEERDAELEAQLADWEQLSAAQAPGHRAPDRPTDQGERLRSHGTSGQLISKRG